MIGRSHFSIETSRRVFDIGMTRLHLWLWRHVYGLDIYLGPKTVFNPRWLYTLQTMHGPIKIGDRCKINAASLRGPLEIGNNVLLNVNSDLAGYKDAPIVIGNDVQIAPYVVILGAMHGYQDRHHLIREQPLTAKAVVIEDDVWVGTHSVILPGVKIGRGAVVSANSVVARDIEPYCVAAGVPARVFAKRGQ